MTAPLSRIVAPHITDHEPAGAGVTMAPVSFGGRFGWLHQPAMLAEGAAGVVLVSPLGRDARCVHRPMRLLADRLARAGYPTLRYDHLGHGDSLDLVGVDDALPTWVEGVGAAADHLKHLTGVARIVLGGFRFGASLASLALADLEGVDGLMLFAPVVTGKTWLRELRLSGAMSGTASAAAEQAGGLEADGLTLSPPTVRAISAMDMKSVAWPAIPTLLFAQNENVAALGPRITERSGMVSALDFAGFDPLFEDAHSNQEPEEAFAQAIHWMRTAVPVDPDADIFANPVAPAAGLTPLGATETPVAFGNGLWGVLTQPQTPNETRRAVIFLNTGGDPRAGIGRFAAVTARALAANGVASLRFDFPGVGDSADPADGRRHIYEVSRTADVRAAMTLMAAEGLDDVTLAGVCAGGHHALQAAIADIGVIKVLAVSPVKLVWRDGHSLAIGKRDQGRATAFYVGGLANPATWKRLVTGDIHVASVLKTLIGRVMGRLAARRDDSTKAFQDQIAAASARGVKVKILVGIDDASLDEVETYFGPKGAHMARLPGMSVTVAPGVDHGLARTESRATALNELVGLVDEPQDRARA